MGLVVLAAVAAALMVLVGGGLLLLRESHVPPLPVPGRRIALRLLAGRVLLIAGVLLTGLAIYVVDGMPAIHDRSKVGACAVLLREIANAAQFYAEEHGDRPPAALAELFSVRYIPFPHVFRCPAATPGDCYEPPDPPGLYGYVWRPGALGDTRAVLCHDAHPHRVRHAVFRFLDRRVRNMVFGDGTVRTVSEREFQALGLPSAPKAQVPTRMGE